jgi:hypothetical protein
MSQSSIPNFNSIEDEIAWLDSLGPNGRTQEQFQRLEYLLDFRRGGL